MRKFKTLLLTCYSLALLTGCKESRALSIEIVEYPKTTFYCGEEFSNTGITLKVTLPDGESFLAEDVATSRPSTAIPGTQSVKVYYTNDKYDIDTFIKYDINVIDWTKEEKAIFGETSISSFSGVYYPKMDGMHMLTETDDETGAIVDYWIQKDNATFKDIDAYTELLKNYHVTKRVSSSGSYVDMTFKFYEQSIVPQDFRDLYDVNDAICYKYCASYIYTDTTYFEQYELYGNEIEDTIVIGLDDNGNMIVRFIANSVFMESILSYEVNEHLDFSGLFNGSVVEYLSEAILGYTDGEGERYLGALEEIAPLAKEYFILPDYEPDVCAVANYASMYPWLHGEDDFCFELEIDSNDQDEYNDFVASIEAKSAFVKTTKQDKVKNKDVNVNVYTISDMDYVGDLIIEVTDFIEDGASYYQIEGSTRVQVTTGCYRVYYRYQAPEIFTPTQPELFKIYDDYFGEGNYSSEDYDIYEDGAVGGLVKYTKAGDNVNSKEEAADKFASKYLTGYTCTKEKADVTLSGFTVCSTQYSNAEFVIDMYSYYSGGKYVVEFSIAIKK